jgi:hypothetical protein
MNFHGFPAEPDRGSLSHHPAKSKKLKTKKENNLKNFEKHVNINFEKMLQQHPI